MRGERLEMGVARLRSRRFCCKLREFSCFLFYFGLSWERERKGKGTNWVGNANACRAYCGFPAGMEAFRAVGKVVDEAREKGEFLK